MLVTLSLCLAMACALPTSHEDNQKWSPAGAEVLLLRLKNQPQIAVTWNLRRVQRALQTSVDLRTPVRTALLVDTRLLRMNGLGRLLSSLTMPGSVEGPSSLMNTS